MNNKTKNLIAFAFTAFVFVFATNVSADTTDNYSNVNNYNVQSPDKHFVNQYDQVSNQPQIPQYSSSYQVVTQPVTPVTPITPVNQTTKPQVQTIRQYTQTGYVMPTGNRQSSNPVVINSNNLNKVYTTKSENTKVIVATNTSVKYASVSQNSVPRSNVLAVNSSNVNKAPVNNLSALSMRGGDSFMPDTVFEWLLTVIFILVIIILIRLMARKHGHGDHH